MPIPTSAKPLTELFESLGASAPESWAQSQISEGINQLHRFLFLRQAWSRILRDGDHSWISSEIAAANEDHDAPYAGIGLALKRLSASGASESDISEVVRGMQAKLLFEWCYLLEDPSLDSSDLEDIGWCLVETDSHFEPTATQISGLHESVLETDPTGREMRPLRAT